MNALAMVIVILLGGVLQALLPVWPRLGQAPVPVLTGVALYYALHRGRGAAFAAAVAAGVVQDALSLTPLGYSAVGFVCITAALHPHRDEVFTGAGLTHVIFGALAAAGLTLLQAALLAGGMEWRVAPGALALKTLGALALGALATPLVFAAVRRVDRFLGLDDASAETAP